jgi:hypothetical protein
MTVRMMVVMVGVLGSVAGASETRPSQAQAAEAFTAFPQVPASVAAGCEESIERGEFKLLKCKSVGASYSFDASGVPNYMQVMRVPGIKGADDCKAFVERVSAGATVTRTNRTPDKTAKFYFSKDGIDYFAMWSEHPAFGKACNVLACNVRAGMNVLSRANMCKAPEDR